MTGIAQPRVLRGYRLPVLMLMAGLVTPAAAHAQKKPPAPVSFSQATSDAQFLFVMLAANPDRDSRNWLMAVDSRAKRVDFTLSGMYQNDGTNKPLWTVEWYSRKVHIASDGMHLVRPGESATSLDDEAVAFFINGRPIKTYRVDDFVDFSRFLPRVDGQTQWMEAELFDDRNLTYTVRTNDGNRFVIDVHSGEIVSSSRPNRTILRTILGIGNLIASIGCMRLAWKYQKHRRAMREMERTKLYG